MIKHIPADVRYFYFSVWGRSIYQCLSGLLYPRSCNCSGRSEVTLRNMGMYFITNLVCELVYYPNKSRHHIYFVAYDAFHPEKLTVYPPKYAHGFVVLCFVVVMQSFIMNSHEVFIHIHQGCFAGTGAIVRLPQYQWSKPDGYGKIGQCITTTKHSKAKTVCIFLGIYCISKTRGSISYYVK